MDEEVGTGVGWPWPVTLLPSLTVLHAVAHSTVHSLCIIRLMLLLLQHFSKFSKLFCIKAVSLEEANFFLIECPGTR